MKLLAQTADSRPAPHTLAQNRPQTVLVTLAVLLAHAGLLAWLQSSSGPVQPPELPVVTMELLASSLAPVQVSQPPPQPEPRQQEQAAPKLVPKPTTQPTPKKVPAAVIQAEPSPSPTTAPSLAPAASAAAASGLVGNAPVKVELPSASADYLNNPKPAYPPLSRRLREEGKVVLRVLIETDGSTSRAEIRSSSGYERLDQAALQTVLEWRYLPARRNGVAEAMWFNVPINFVLE